MPNSDPLHPAPSRAKSFHYAFAGCWHVLRTQRNAWIHFLLSVAAIVAGIVVRLGRIEWAIIVLTIALVWLAEFINTALEAVVDLASPDLHPLAKVSKDVSAGAVLVAAVAAAIVGLLILGPPLLALTLELFATGRG